MGTEFTFTGNDVVLGSAVDGGATTGEPVLILALFKLDDLYAASGMAFAPLVAQPASRTRSHI